MVIAFIRILGRLFRRSRRIEEKLDRLLSLQESTMSALDDLTTAINEETNTVAAKLDHLSAELAAAVAAGQAPTPAQLAALQAISDRLKSLGADPVAPIPAPVATPVT